MPHIITRKFAFDSAHRVLGHEGKCRHLHGHRYEAHVGVYSLVPLDRIGRVVDFSEIKTRIGGWIDQHWDHNFLCHPDDPLYSLFAADINSPIFGGKAPWVMRNGNPTAENIAQELFIIGQGLLSLPLRIASVTIYETPNCWAAWTPDDVSTSR